MFKKKIRSKLYIKAPSKFLLQQAKRLQKWAFLSFVLSLLLIVLSNPFTYYEQARQLPQQLTELSKQLPQSRQELAQLLSTVPEFVKILPSEAEKSSFAFFDWTKAQLKNTEFIFAKENILVDKEAGQSAVPPAKVEKDYASLPFFIEIPKLSVYEKVQANVNPNVASEYEAALEEGVAHALGSAFPGQDKLIYIFGHSTDGAWNVEAFNAVFYQIKDLQPGDQITLHLGEEKFLYEVSKQDIIKSSEIDFVNKLKNQDVLLLQTCWPPGTSWQRLFVSAVPVEN